MKFDKSGKLFHKAQSLMPGGVNSPVRAFKSVGGEPLYIQSGKGSHITDVDGNQFIDYVASWGPLILGHSHPQVIKAIKETALSGTSFGTCHANEILLAKLIIDAIPNIEKIRFVNSGTEAVMSAIRAARAYAGREKIIKFDGCYHGHYDNLLVKAGSGLATLGIPSSKGISAEAAKNTISLPYNDLASVEKTIQQNSNAIAAIILEPIAANMGVVLPEEGFLNGLGRLCKDYAIVLIFDEVITGFRMCYGGVQNIYNIKPDLTILGKIIGGGLPVGAYGGKKEIMQLIAPEGDVYQAGTLSGNPIAMSAGIATLSLLKKSNYKKLSKTAADLTHRLSEVFEQHHIKAVINRAGPMFTCFFLDQRPKNFNDVNAADTKLYASFFWGLIRNNVYFPPSQFEACFVSFAHTSQDIERTVQAVKRAL
jgi:glutamate-1-semialdehyde-2,1-aminomutase